jgi:hypothetical protein
VALVGDAAAIEAGVRAFGEVGVTDLVAAIPREPADSARATSGLLAGLARRGA